MNFDEYTNEQLAELLNEVNAEIAKKTAESKKEKRRLDKIAKLEETLRQSRQAVQSIDIKHSTIA